jgi:hypothetical protein
MKRVSLSVAVAAALVFAGSSAARAADAPVHLTLDGRPVDRTGGIAVMHNGVVLADVVDLTKAFDGLLTFPDRRSVTVTINGTTVRFRVGTITAVANDKPFRMRAAPIMHNGDIFVPLQTFATLGGATVNLTKGRADIRISVNPNTPQAPSATFTNAPTPAASAMPAATPKP